ncbi:MAG: hypothetical protein P1U58_19935 [Verrucomicrobiales bacterium]|nr:hypothetical protein [Verrucomicrobiales bacterium]
MKLAKAVSRSHPVLTPLSDDVAPNGFEADLRVESDRDRWFIEVDLQFENPALSGYLESGACALGLHLECRRTFYRGFHTLSDDASKVIIPGSELRGKVEASVIAVSTREIPQYRVSGQHPDYGDRSFVVGPGEILAAAAPMHFDALLDFDPIEKVSSILSIDRADSEEARAVEMDLFNPGKVIVILPQADFDLYQQLRTDKSLEGLMVSNVLFPVILEVLHFIASLSDEALEEAKIANRWVRSIIRKLDELGLNLNAGENPCFRAAQEILKNPLRRGLMDLNDLGL